VAAGVSPLFIVSIPSKTLWPGDSVAKNRVLAAKIRKTSCNQGSTKHFGAPKKSSILPMKSSIVQVHKSLSE
jgi:hypothetical protein